MRGGVWGFGFALRINFSGLDASVRKGIVAQGHPICLELFSPLIL
jgi:hypothetical protein